MRGVTKADFSLRVGSVFLYNRESYYNEYDFHNTNYSSQICQITMIRAGATRSYMLFIAVPYLLGVRSTSRMTMQDFYGLAVLFSIAAPFTIIVYLIALLLIRPPLRVFFPSVLAGLVMGVINLGFDLTAYYAHWWHYSLKELVWHLPLPFYMIPILIYGSMIYLLIWRFWHGRWHWLARVLLFGLPIFGIVRDIVNVAIGASYIVWDSFWGPLMTIVMWPVMFYAGYLLFARLAPSRQGIEADQQPDDEASVQKATQ